MSSPRGSDNDLRYAIFTLKEDNIPQSLNIPSSIISLTEMPVKSYNFEKELHIITNYEELKRQNSDKRERVESITLESLSISSNPDQQQQQQQQQQQSPDSVPVPVTTTQLPTTEQLPLSARSRNGNEGQATVAAIVTASPIDTNTAATTQVVTAQVANPPIPPPKPTKEQLQENAIISMMQQTKQERNVCMFYLDSMNWDLPAALAMYFDMMEQTNS